MNRAAAAATVRCTHRIRAPVDHLIMQPSDLDQVTTSITTTDAAIVTWYMPLSNLQQVLHRRYQAEQFGEMIHVVTAPDGESAVGSTGPTSGCEVIPLGFVTLVVGKNHPNKQTWMERVFDPAPHPTLSLRVAVVDRVHWQRTVWMVNSICRSACWGRIPQKIFSIDLDWKSDVLIDANFNVATEKYDTPYSVQVPNLGFHLTLKDTGRTLLDRETPVVDGFLDNESALRTLALAREVNMQGLGGCVYRQVLWSTPCLPNIAEVTRFEPGDLLKRCFGVDPPAHAEPVAAWLVRQVDRTLVYKMEGEVEDENEPNSATTYGDRSLTERVQKKAMNRYNGFRDDALPSMASQKQRVGKYELGKVLASGYFDCRTRLCTHIVTGAQYVVRIYNKNTLAEAKWMWERIREAIHVMRTLPKHENIIEISELFETESSLYILMQLFAPMHVTKMYTTDAPTGERITVPIQRTKLLFTQVVRGLRHMHDCDVVHFGLAPDHVMVNSQDQVKIGGLVSCKYVPKGTKLCRDIRGTMHTVAPEVLRNGEYDPYLADAWSLGVLLYFMLHRGRYPHDGANTTKNILYHRIRPPDPNLPVEAQDLLRSLLSHDPTTRLRVEQIMDHPFFTMEHTDVMMTDGHLSGPQSGAPYWKVSGTLGTPAWKGTLQQRLPYSYSSEETAAYLIQQFYRAYRSHRKNRSGCTLGSSRRNSIYRGRNQVVDVVQPNFRQPRKTLSGFGFGEVDTNHLLDKASSIAPNYSQRRAMCGIPDTSVGLIPHGQGSEETIPIRCRGGSMTSECNGSTLMLSCSDSEGGILNVTQVSRMNLSTTSNATHLSVRQQGSHKLSFEVPGDNLRLTSPNPVLGATDCIADAASGSCNEGGIPLRFYARTPSINHMRGNDMHPWDGDSRGAEGLLPKIKVDPMRRCPVCNRPPPQRAIRIKPYLHTPYEYKKGVFKDKTAVVSD